MVAAMCLYLDDSGTRHPDRKVNLPKHGHDWFAMGGVLLKEDDEEALRAEHAAFIAKWKIQAPLHSAEIRARSQKFAWLGKLTKEQMSSFMADLGALATRPELTALACVVDRPGYNHRYREKYGRARWQLCRTAFSIVVERAAKFAAASGYHLRVFVEKSDKETDANLLGYYNELRSSGHPFDKNNASKYVPLASEALRETLYEFRTKSKASPPMQIADLCLWPMCMGGYEPGNNPYQAMKAAGTLIDCKLKPVDVATLGIKYSCWDLELQAAEKTKPGA